MPRLGSVRLKGGATLHIIRNSSAESCTNVLDAECADIHKYRSADFAGFAIVAWGIDGGAYSTIRVFNSGQVGRSMVPDFTRSLLIQHLATD
jgi:hypothetical protein